MNKAWDNTPEYRYMNDPIFHRVVQTLETLIYECQLTPNEVREAAMLAAIHYEEKTLRQNKVGL